MTHPDGVGKHQDRLHIAKRQFDLSTKYTNKSLQYNLMCCIDWHDQLEWLWRVLVLFNPVLTPLTANCICVSSGMMTAWRPAVLESAAVSHLHKAKSLDASDTYKSGLLASPTR